jgi:hypothetical protein
MIGPSQLVQNAHCVTKHSLHRLFLDLRGRGSDEELSRVLVAGYDTGRLFFKSASPDCNPRIVKTAVEEISAAAKKFVEHGGLEALDPEIRKQLIGIAGPALLPAAAMGFLVAVFEQSYAA